MPESNAAPTQPGEQAPDTHDAQQPDNTPEELSDFAKEKVAKANSEAKNLRKRLQELEPLAREAVESREAQKSELQKLQDKHEALLMELAESNRAAIRERVARQTGLPDELAELLRGDSEEEIAEHAKRLQAVVAPPSQGDRVRRPDPSQGLGNTGGATALNGDPLLRDLKSKLHIP